MRNFHTLISNKDIDNRISTCYDNIKRKLTNKSENLELLLTIRIVKVRGKDFLYADIDDEVSFQEWDFENVEDFENAIAKYLTPIINRKIKIVTEKKKHKYIKISRYYMDDNDEWILIDEDIINYFLIRLFIIKDSTKVEFKSYKI